MIVLCTTTLVFLECAADNKKTSWLVARSAGILIARCTALMKGKKNRPVCLLVS